MHALLDVNVLLPLLDRLHVDHLAAVRWLAANLTSGWASCPLTENACLRLLTNPRYSSPQSPERVLAALEMLRNSSHHVFWPADLSIIDNTVFDWNRLQGPQQVTDVYLLALAVAHGGRLVTFDQRIQFEMVRGCRPEHLLILRSLLAGKNRLRQCGLWCLFSTPNCEPSQKDRAVGPWMVRRSVGHRLARGNPVLQRENRYAYPPRAF